MTLSQLILELQGLEAEHGAKAVELSAEVRDAAGETHKVEALAKRAQIKHQDGVASIVVISSDDGL